MSGQEPLARLDALRFVRLIDGWIADEKRREAERRPASPEWLVEYGIDQELRLRYLSWPGFAEVAWSRRPF